ncbi:MAG: NifU N-terminal domain-containing protein [bacterium]
MTDPVTIDVQPTPNINAMKFVVNRRLTEGKSRTFRTPEEAADAPLATALLSIPGVVQVFFLNDFITITRDPKSDWAEIAGPAEEAIREQLGSAG